VAAAVARIQVDNVAQIQTAFRRECAQAIQLCPNVTAPSLVALVGRGLFCCEYAEGFE
jgi:hypothetical protein